MRLETQELKHINRRLDDIDKEIDDNLREQKSAIKELREETQESLQELKQVNQQILDIVRPLQFKISGIEKTSEQNSSEVSKIKAKPGQTYEGYKDKFITAIISFFATTMAGGILWLIIQSVGSK